MDNLKKKNKKNLVMTAACGFGVDQLQLFLKSLRKHFNGSVCFVIGNQDVEIEKELEKYNCICIKKKVDKRDIQLKRYKFFLEYLLDNSNYSNILFCDSRDIFFQKNPFDYDYQGSINFFLEDKKIYECKYNSQWMLGTYGKKIFNELSNKIISCGGTILGKQESIKKFLKLMIDETSKKRFKKRLKYLLTFRRDPNGRGSDQSHGNYIAHNNLIENSFYYSNKSGPIATIYHLEKILFNKDHQLINSKGEPYNVVHQYDKRWDEMKVCVMKLQKELNIKN